jgi:hypothetical protein
MTPEWFEDLAQRCSEASMFAFYDDEPSMAKDFQMARQSAIDYAYSQRKAIEKIRSAPPDAEIAELAPPSEDHNRHVA